MNENITPVDFKNIISVSENNLLSDLNPSERTLSFIRQFARCYHEETRLPLHLSGIILN
jgi:hypothetical protein